MRKRVAWIDVAKFLDIFAIFLGHLPSKNGESMVKWVYVFSVPLFFFLAGCMETYNKRTFVPYFLHKVKMILVPLFIFAILTVVMSLLFNGNADSARLLLIQFPAGFIRNHSVGALWFLPCLFVMEILFYAVKKLRKWYLILGISLMCFCIAFFVLDPSAIRSPSWYWNLDSALFYIPFFAMGYLAYPLLQKWFGMNSRYSRLIFHVTGMLAIFYMACCLLGKEPLGSIWGINSILLGLSHIVRPLFCIFGVLYMSKCLEGIALFSKLGQETLMFCGGEYIAKLLIIKTMAMLGVSMEFIVPIQAYIFVVVELSVTHFVLVPIFNLLINKAWSLANAVRRTEMYL